MRRKDEKELPGPPPPPWTRRALISLWLVAFALAAAALAVRWEALMTSLAGVPMPTAGALR
jgi:hypothetical protein